MDNTTTSVKKMDDQKNYTPVKSTVVNIIIRDFIHLTECLSPDNLVELMNDFYGKVCTQVSQHQGILASISNYNIVVTFSEVAGADPHARRSLRCALAVAMIAYQMRFYIQQTFPEQGLDKFGVGIGIHSGDLIFAEFGLPPHVHYVASGHAVSVASLLAVKSKELKWNIVCSKQTLEIAGGGIGVEQSTLIGVEWLNQPVSVAEVVSVSEGAEAADMSAEIPDGTLVFERGARPGQSPTFDSTYYAAGEEARTAECPIIRGYRCLRPIGQGGMSRVYLVERLRDGTQMALKFADGSISENSDMLFRFVEEYALLEQICHPNVLQIYDQGVTDDALFIVMEYLPGGTLKHQIGKEGMASELALRILREVVLALAEVHRTGIIHCDIKPENILLRDDGTAVLSDFGIARRVIKARHAGNVSSVVGTPYFMSPEQVLGENEDERTDIYSMGAVFYNMLTGEKPYLGDTLEEIMQKHLKAPVPQLPQRHQHLQPLLDRMMAKDKEQRCSMAELLALLDELRK